MNKILFKDANELKIKIDSYVKHCDGVYIDVNLGGKELHQMTKPLTIVGFCNYISIDPSTFREYAKKEDFKRVCSYFKGKCEQQLIERALTNTANSNVSIFVLKNNFGYTDKQEVTNVGEQSIIVKMPMKNKDN